ncbi:MAG: Gfo/Idh/MocA family oxidoreductase, partial [bacterium]|nr:Gfo/Idh/MocA family oxidoreductase [bacterium]
MIAASIGLIGLGYWGRNLLRCLHTFGVLRAACDANTQTIAHHQREYPDVRFVEHASAIIDDPSITAVAIATPAVTHTALARMAIAAGKDVFIEKPLALSHEDGEAIVREARSRGRVLMVGHILQYHPAVLALHTLVRDGAIGTVQYCYSNRLNIGKLRTEENIWWSFAPHDISVMLSLLSAEPVSVQSFGGSYVSEGIYDTTVTTLAFPNGVKGHIYVSWLHPYKEQRFVVVGSSAMAVFDDCAEEKLVLYEHRIDWSAGIPVAKKADPQPIPRRSAEPLQEELAHFLQCR